MKKMLTLLSTLSITSVGLLPVVSCIPIESTNPDTSWFVLKDQPKNKEELTNVAKFYREERVTFFNKYEEEQLEYYKEHGRPEDGWEEWGTNNENVQKFFVYSFLTFSCGYKMTQLGIKEDIDLSENGTIWAIPKEKVDELYAERMTSLALNPNYIVFYKKALEWLLAPVY